MVIDKHGRPHYGEHGGAGLLAYTTDDLGHPPLPAPEAEPTGSPAGNVVHPWWRDPRGESPAKAAIREAIEETGPLPRDA